MKIDEQTKQLLLSNAQVIEEIDRHKWLQSELAGKDIGWEHASKDWLKKYAKDWIAYHMPDQLRKFDS